MSLALRRDNLVSAKAFVIDYGGGNFLSVQRALLHCGAEVEVAETPKAVAKADMLILPGVGAFSSVMKALHQRDMVSAIRAYAKSGRPFLGICVGMQVLFERSDEFGGCDGLAILRGSVERIPNRDFEGHSLRLPHIGWNRLKQADTGDDILLRGISPDAAFVYFTHSYFVRDPNPAVRVADCTYGGHRLAAIVREGSVSGCQFHPEKSGEVGLKILLNFLASPDQTDNRMAAQT